MQRVRHYLRNCRWQVGLTALAIVGVSISAPPVVCIVLAGLAIASWVAKTAAEFRPQLPAASAAPTVDELEPCAAEEPAVSEGEPAFTVGDIELADLFTSIHDDVARMVATMRGELSQVGAVQRDAIRDLDASFSELSGHAARQQLLVARVVKEALNRVDDGADPQWGRRKTAEVTAISTLVNHSLGQAVRCLQFEDLLSQLLHHVDRRCMLVESVMHGIADEQVKLLTAVSGDSDSYSASLRSLRGMIVEHSHLFDEIGNKVVTQNSMEEGVVELF